MGVLILYVFQQRMTEELLYYRNKLPLPELYI